MRLVWDRRHSSKAHRLVVSTESLWEATGYLPRSAEAGHSSVIAAFSASGTDTRAMRLEK